MTSPTVKVKAPMDLDEGFMFDAEVDGKAFKVKVPAGGVKAGDELEVPNPFYDAGPWAPMDMEQGKSGGTAMTTAPTGAWKVDLFSCFETCPCPFFMACCCPGILTGQVFQRLKYNIIGIPAQGDGYKNTCVIMTGLFFLTWLIAVIMAAATGWGTIFWYIFYIYVIVALTLGRNNFRKKYNIPAKHCGESILDDCCCAWWCGCCTILQMHRHTHDERQYPYEIGSNTGLAMSAPEIV